MIRQAISCDICGAEKKQTNHWFVAYNQAGELRVSGWNSRNRLRAESKHLCGQTCLHKLVDEFMAKAISGRSQAGADEFEVPEGSAGRTDDRGLERSASGAAVREASAGRYVADGPVYDDGESSARLVKRAAPTVPAVTRALPFRTHPELVPQPGRSQPSIEPSLPDSHPGARPDPPGDPAAAADSAPRFASRQWRAEAWNRECSRELRNGNTDINVRRRAGS